jgi:hypothetical protein
MCVVLCVAETRVAPVDRQYAKGIETRYQRGFREAPTRPPTGDPAANERLEKQEATDARRDRSLKRSMLRKRPQAAVGEHDDVQPFNAPAATAGVVSSNTKRLVPLAPVLSPLDGSGGASSPGITEL